MHYPALPVNIKEQYKLVGGCHNGGILYFNRHSAGTTIQCMMCNLMAFNMFGKVTRIFTRY